MDSGSDGKFVEVFDGQNKPGVMSFVANGLRTGVAYKFKVAALNFNGHGPLSEEATFFSCLPPKDILPPQFVTSSDSTLSIGWSEPRQLNGCPLQGYNIFVDDGTSESETFVLPHTNQFDILSSNADRLYTVKVEAVTASGRIMSGVNTLKMTNVPSKPAPVVNDASMTNADQIKVVFSPDENVASPIVNIQLFMDNGNGGDLVPLTLENEVSLDTSKVITGLQAAKLYRFAYRVANVNGWSELSDSVMIRAAI